MAHLFDIMGSGLEGYGSIPEDIAGDILVRRLAPEIDGKPCCGELKKQSQVIFFVARDWMDSFITEELRDLGATVFSDVVSC